MKHVKLFEQFLNEGWDEDGNSGVFSIGNKKVNWSIRYVFDKDSTFAQINVDTAEFAEAMDLNAFEAFMFNKNMNILDKNCKSMNYKEILIPVEIKLNRTGLFQCYLTSEMQKNDILINTKAFEYNSNPINEQLISLNSCLDNILDDQTKVKSAFQLNRILSNVEKST